MSANSTSPESTDHADSHGGRSHRRAHRVSSRIQAREIFFVVALTALICALLFTIAGCVPQPQDDNPTIVAGVADQISTLTGGSTSAPATAAPPPAGDVVLNGNIDAGEYELFPLSAANIGERIRVSPARLLLGRSFLIALFDADQNLLYRGYAYDGGAVTHVIREDTPQITVGVHAVSGSVGGDFSLDIRRTGGAEIPALRTQVVYLNFAGGSSVRIHGRDPISFSAFSGDQLGQRYASQTAALKAAIVAAVRSDYASYDVVVLSSDDGPPPEFDHSTVHFGGRDTRLLGLADSVDQYNTNLAEGAIIYVESFREFEIMQLDVEEIGQMIGNTASHELGHLLGLYHTAAANHIMDTTGSAWDLVQDQDFAIAALERTVFPTGFENAPALLSQSVGLTTQASSAKLMTKEKLARQSRVRAMIEASWPTRCGTCLDPDH